MNKMEELIAASKIGELMHKKETEERQKNTVLLLFAVIGVVLAVAGIAFFVYKKLTKKAYDDFDDDFEDDFDYDFFEEEDEEADL